MSHACLEQFNERIGEDSPFTQGWHFADGRLRTNGHWLVSTPKKTPAGNPSRTRYLNIILTYCPFCGERLEPE
jgi:hypothetical protein